MLISYFDLIPKSWQEVKLVPPKPEIGWHTYHYEIIETHSFYYIKKDNIDDIICSFTLKQISDLESNHNLLAKAIMNTLNQKKEKSLKLQKWLFDKKIATFYLK